VGEIPEVKVALAGEVEETAWRGNEDIDATLDLLPLGAIPDAAINQSDSKSSVFREFLEGFTDLVGQFAGGFKNEGAEFPGFF
jgi:hypothetical protein